MVRGYNSTPNAYLRFVYYDVSPASEHIPFSYSSSDSKHTRHTSHSSLSKLIRIFPSPRSLSESKVSLSFLQPPQHAFLKQNVFGQEWQEIHQGEEDHPVLGLRMSIYGPGKLSFADQIYSQAVAQKHFCSPLLWYAGASTNTLLSTIHTTSKFLPAITRRLSKWQFNDSATANPFHFRLSFTHGWIGGKDDGRYCRWLLDLSFVFRFDFGF
jgi:hypothetical protein